MVVNSYYKKLFKFDKLDHSNSNSPLYRVDFNALNNSDEVEYAMNGFKTLNVLNYYYFRI